MFKKTLSLGLSIAALMLTAAGCKEKQSAEDYLRSGERYYQQQLYGKARVEYRNALSIDSKNASAHFGLAKLAKDKEDPSGQFFHLTKAVQFDGENPNFQYQLGEIALLMGELAVAQSAEKHLRELEPASERRYKLSLAVFIAQQDWAQVTALGQEALAVFPESADLWGLKGVAAKKQEHWAAALEALDRAIALEGDSSQYRLLRIEVNQASGDVFTAIEDLKMILNDGDYSDVQVIKLIKMVNDLSGREAAIVELKPYIKKYPRADALQVLLVDLIKQDNPAKAGKLLDQFIQQAENPTGLLFYRVNVALMNSNVVLAEQDLQRVLSVPEQSTIALANGHAMLAEIAWLKGDAAAAKEHLAAALNAGDSTAKTLLLQAKIALNEGLTTEAVSYLNKCLAKNSNDTEALSLLGQIYQQQGKAELAADFYQRALQQEPYNYPALRFQIADAFDKKHFTKADALLTRSLSQYPDDTALLSIKLQVAALRGNQQEAYALLDALKSVQSDVADIAYLDGFILQQQGKHADAVKLFAKAISLRGQFDKALNAMRQSSQAANDWQFLENFLQRHTAKNPDDLSAQLLLAQLTVASGSTSPQKDADSRAVSAEQQISTVLERHPEWTDGTIWLANLRFAQGDEKGALSLLGKFYQQFRNASVGIAYARSLEKGGAFADAAEVYEQVLQNDSSNLIARNNYALLLVGELKKEASVRKALQLTQGFDSAASAALLDTRGVVLMEAQKYAQAHYAFDRALELADIVDIRLNYATSLMRGGKPERANSMLDRLAGANQNDPEVLRKIVDLRSQVKLENDSATATP